MGGPRPVRWAGACHRRWSRVRRRVRLGSKDSGDPDQRLGKAWHVWIAGNTF